MPYKIIMGEDGKHCVVKSADGKKIGCHDTHEKAMAQMKALYANEAMSTMMWVDPFQYTAGKPFRIFPIGTFKRGERTIDLTNECLAQMKANYEAQRPRWKIPIYAGHPTETQPDPPKLGNVATLDLQSDGLYATPELTDEGIRLIESGAYQYCSPGIHWQGYTDEQGNEFQNVLDHLALSNKPYFGSATAIFSSDENLMKDNDGVMGKLSELIDMFKEFITKEHKLEGFMIDDPKTMIKNSYLPDDLLRALQTISRLSEELGQHDVKMGAKLSSAKKSLQDVVAEIVSMYDADFKRGNNHMTEPITTPVVSVDEFNALKAKAGEFDAKIKAQADEFATKLEAEKKRAEEFATRFADEQKARVIESLKTRAEKFAVALPVKPDEYAEKFYALTEKDAELAKWFMAKFDALNTQLAQSALFSQLSRNTDPTVETISTVADKILAEKFSGDMTKYKDALTEAGKLRPDLANAGLMSR